MLGFGLDLGLGVIDTRFSFLLLFLGGKNTPLPPPPAPSPEKKRREEITTGDCDWELVLGTFTSLLKTPSFLRLLLYPFFLFL